MAAWNCQCQFRQKSFDNVMKIVILCFLVDACFFFGCEGASHGVRWAVEKATPMGASHLVASNNPLLLNQYQNNNSTHHQGEEDEGRVAAGGEAEERDTTRVTPLDHHQADLLYSSLTLTLSLALSLVVLAWVKRQMSGGKEGEEECGGHQWMIRHPAIRPILTTTQQSTSPPQQSAHPQPCEWESVCETGAKAKPKGLLERRGSSASLTIDLVPTNPTSNPAAASVTPTRECTTEEFLLSVGNVLNRSQLRSCLKDVRALHREFCDLPLNHPDKVHVPGSWSKNRYMTVIPNEATRVRLPSDSNNDNLASYINANYITGYEGEEKAFIATQGPLAHTVNDFWAMIWSDHVPVIVMITKLWEKSKSKCEPYFPTELNNSQTYGDFVVTVTAITNREGYILRHLQVQCGEEKRMVSHFWFDSWPDHRTPPNTHSLLALAKEVEVARFAGGSQRRLSAAWLSSPMKESVSPVLTLGSLELKSSPSGGSPLVLDNVRVPPRTDTSTKKRTREADNRDIVGDKFFKSPLNNDAVFRFENESGECTRTSRSKSEESDFDSPLPADSTSSVFWKFEKLSTGGSATDSSVSPSWLVTAADSPSDRSPFRSSLDSPAFTSSSSSASSNKRWGSKGRQSSDDSAADTRWGDALTELPTEGRAVKASGPTVVHCSAGIGRTGCFIAISIGINQLLWENNVDILSIVCRMRYNRGGMVQTAEQYEFIHRALALFERSLPESGE